MKMKSILSLFFVAAMATGFTSCAQVSTQKKSDIPSEKDLSKYSKATFAAGCFWHEEALYDGIKGVVEAVSGYAGGTTDNPDYETVSTGNSGHAESVMVYYDSSKVTFPILLKAYFNAQDPTSVNGQDPDYGTQYRSIAFYNNDAEKKQIEDYIRQLNASGNYDKPIAVQVVHLTKFWKAEEYHQEYVKKNPNSSYVKNVCIREVKHFQKQFPELVKPGHFY